MQPDGKKEIVSENGGSPNGLAIGPDGAVYVCNSGGYGSHDMGGLTIPDSYLPGHHSGGRIERVDLATGEVTVLYRECDGHELIGPNDLVFDETGGFWFTDHGRWRERDKTHGGLYYARPDGSEIREVVYPLDGPNGVGLSPDGKRVYAAETYAGRLFAWDLAGPGEVAAPAPPVGNGGELVCGLPGMQLFDSLAVDGDGNVGRRDARERRDHRDRAGRQQRRARAVPRPDGDQHLLRGRRSAHRLRDVLGDRKAGVGALALAGPEAGLLALWSPGQIRRRVHRCTAHSGGDAEDRAAPGGVFGVVGGHDVEVVLIAAGETERRDRLRGHLEHAVDLAVGVRRTTHPARADATQRRPRASTAIPSGAPGGKWNARRSPAVPSSAIVCTRITLLRVSEW